MSLAHQPAFLNHTCFELAPSVLSEQHKRVSARKPRRRSLTGPVRWGSYLICRYELVAAKECQGRVISNTSVQNRGAKQPRRSSSGAVMEASRAEQATPMNDAHRLLVRLARVSLPDPQAAVETNRRPDAVVRLGWAGKVTQDAAALFESTGRLPSGIGSAEKLQDPWRKMVVGRAG
jgi:hypothetical protein